MTDKRPVGRPRIHPKPSPYAPRRNPGRQPVTEPLANADRAAIAAFIKQEGPVSKTLIYIAFKDRMKKQSVWWHIDVLEKHGLIGLNDELCYVAV